MLDAVEVIENVDNNANQVWLVFTDKIGLYKELESILLDTMCEIPSTKGVTEVAISGEVVEGEAKPLYIYGESKEAKEKSVS